MLEPLGTIILIVQTEFPYIKIGFQKNPKCFFWTLWNSLWVPVGTLYLWPFPPRWERNKNFTREFLGA